MGRTLAEVIKEGGPPILERAVNIVRQIARALAAAHEVGIVHRDLKPDNVFLVGEDDGVGGVDEVRVVDFGAAKVVGANRTTRDGVIFGTPHYMSPEHASGQPVDHRADLYSLGVILYEMLTGRVPFEADTYMGVLTQHMFVKPVPPTQALANEGVTRSGRDAVQLAHLERVALICLSKKPEERYPSMAALAADLDRVSSDFAPSSRRRAIDTGQPSSAAAEDPWVLPKRRVSWVWMVSGVVVAALLLGVWTWVRQEGVQRGPSSRPPAQPTASMPPAGPSVLTTSSAPPTALSATSTAPKEEEASRSPPSMPPVPPGPSVSAGTSAPLPSTATHKVPTVGKPAGERARRPPPAGIDDVGDPFAPKR